MHAWKKAATSLALCLAVAGQAFASGAIVVNEEENASIDDFSFVTQARSADMAAFAALYECQMQGHNSCIVMARFEQCGALAASEKFFRTGTGATAAQAMIKALKNCPGCEIAQVSCETPDGASQLAQVR